MIFRVIATLSIVQGHIMGFQISTHHPVSLSRQMLLQHPQKMELSSLNAKKVRVVIVGAGIGGLAIASRIASGIPSRNCTESTNEVSDCEVLVIEKNSIDMAGGRCGSFDVDLTEQQQKQIGGIFRHERGPSLLLLKHVYESLFYDCCGQSAKAHGLDITQCIPAYKIIFDDGDWIEMGFPSSSFLPEQETEKENEEVCHKRNDVIRDLYMKSRRKLNSFERNGAEKWDGYMKAMSAFLNCGLPNFIEERMDLESFPDFMREATREGFKYWPLSPHSDVLDATFQSNKLKALASFQDLYVGLSPYRSRYENDGARVPGWIRGFGGVMKKTAPAVFGLLSAIELHPTNDKAGVFAPIGGFRAVTKACMSLATNLGVKFLFDSTVVDVSEEGVSYVMRDGSHNFVPTDLTIVNADLPYSVKSILNSQCERDEALGRDKLPKYDWEDSFDYSNGVVAFHWSLNITLDCLNAHNVFLVAGSQSQIQQSWRYVQTSASNVEHGVNCFEPFNFYVHRPAAVDETAAPPGCDSIMVLVPCKMLKRDAAYGNLPRNEAIKRYKSQFSEIFVKQMRDAVLSRLAVLPQMVGIKPHIVHEYIDTPGTYADDYNLAAGVPFGLSHGFGQLSLSRPGAEYEGLTKIMFVGASSRPGNGVPLVLIGAKSVAQKALQRISTKQKTANNDHSSLAS